MANVGKDYEEEEAAETPPDIKNEMTGTTRVENVPFEEQ